MTTKTTKKELLDEYLDQMAPLAPIAMKAFGSRATDSDAHSASAKYTALLVEFTDKGGSLLMLAEALGVTYPALRRRVMTAKIAPLPRSTRSTAVNTEYIGAQEVLTKIKATHNTALYHDTIKEYYDKGLSLNKLAKFMGLKSAYPLYYGLNKSRMRQDGAL